VLLVDDYQVELRKRCEQRRAGADGDPGLTAPDEIPLVVALTWRQTRVQYRHLRAEARPEAPDGLWRERYLGHQHAGVPTALEHRLDRLKVDLGLARAGDAVEHDDLTGPSLECATDRGECLVLSGRELPVARRRLLTNDRITHPPAMLDADRPRRDQSLERSVDRTKIGGQLRHANRAGRERVEDRALDGR